MEKILKLITFIILIVGITSCSKERLPTYNIKGYYNCYLDTDCEDFVNIVHSNVLVTKIDNETININIENLDLNNINATVADCNSIEVTGVENEINDNKESSYCFLIEEADYECGRIQAGSYLSITKFKLEQQNEFQYIVTENFRLDINLLVNDTLNKSVILTNKNSYFVDETPSGP